MAKRAKTVKQARGKQRRSIWSDPVTRYLALAIGFVIAGGLMTLAAMLVLGVVPLSQTPSSRSVAQVGVQQADFKLNPDAQNWGALIVVLGQSGRMVEAQQQLAAAQKTKLDVTQNQAILYAQAQLLIIQKKYGEALPVLEQVKSKLRDAYEKELKNGGDEQNWAVAHGMPTNHYAASLNIAQIYRAQGKKQEALDELNYYLKANPTEGGVLTDRASLKYEMGDFAGAAADYKQALTYLPDSKEAQDGLKKAEAGK